MWLVAAVVAAHSYHKAYEQEYDATKTAAARRAVLSSVSAKEECEYKEVFVVHSSSFFKKSVSTLPVQARQRAPYLIE